MSQPKRFYWMKLKESFMTSDIIDYFMSQPGGANYVVLYQMLCLKTINTNGRMCRQIGEIIIPFDIEKIKRDCKWFSEDTIRVALQLYQAFGLIYEDVDGTLVLSDHSNLVGSETDAAHRMRNSRANKAPALPESVTLSEQCANIVTPDIRDKRLEIDIRDKRGEKEDKSSLVGAGTPPPLPPPVAVSPPVVISILLNDKTEYPITEEDVKAWKELYPAVNIIQELRKMKGWADANPTKRKTARGIKRFINSWLAKEQDKHHEQTGGRQRGTFGSSPAVGRQL